jgi:LytS/YehU family sensor histidine kinase
MSEKQKVRLEEELQSLKLYLELEQARFQNDFTFDLILEESIDKRMIEVPSMLIQPYVENAVKHGLLHHSGHKHLLISFELNEGILQVVIDDNGIGRRRSEEINNNKYNKPRSFSTESNRTRLELINQNNNVVSVKYIDKEDHGEPQGTTVVLSISINNEAI